MSVLLLLASKCFYLINYAFYQVPCFFIPFSPFPETMDGILQGAVQLDMTLKAFAHILNKKPSKMPPTQLYNLARRSIKFSVSLLVILPQTVTELCASVPAAPVLRTFVQYLIAFCSQPEAAGDVIFGRVVRVVVPDKCVKFCDPRLKCSPEIRHEVIRGGIYDRFFQASVNVDQK